MHILEDPSTDLRRHNRPAAAEEVAALVVDATDSRESTRDVMVRQRPTQLNPEPLQKISATSELYLPLHYVLIFPYGEGGWKYKMKSVHLRNLAKRRRVEVSEFSAQTGNSIGSDR